MLLHITYSYYEYKQKIQVASFKLISPDDEKITKRKADQMNQKVLPQKKST